MRAQFHRFKPPFPLITLLVAAFPVLLIFDLLGYAFKAAVHLGHWPSYANPDPKQLGWSYEHGVVLLAWISFPMVSLGAIILAILGRFRSQNFPAWSVSLVAIASFVVFLVYCRIDPGGMVAWFWD